MPRPSLSSTTLTPTVPAPLAALYRETSAATPGGLPLISHLLRDAMVSALLEAGIPAEHPSLAPLSPTRTTAATTAATNPEARAARSSSNAATYHGDLERRQGRAKRPRQKPKPPAESPDRVAEDEALKFPDS